MKRILLSQWIALLLASLLLASCGQRQESSIKVHATIEEPPGDAVIIQWYVKNISDVTITFAKNHLAILQTSLTKQYPIPTNACVLAPGEEVIIQFEILDLDRTVSNHVSITVECREGTKVTHRFQIPRDHGVEQPKAGISLSR